jgi:V-type H+-transporting ATPase subunit a
MLSLFGYMIAMIFIKWSFNWPADSNGVIHAPSLITNLMNIFLKLGAISGEPLWGNEYSQVLINRIVLVIALVCVPIMLFPKPIILYQNAKQRKQQEANNSNNNNYNMIVEDVNVTVNVE